MISAVSAAASGMNDAMVRVDVAAHNIANVNTAGFSAAHGELGRDAARGASPRW